MIGHLRLLACMDSAWRFQSSQSYPIQYVYPTVPHASYHTAHIRIIILFMRNLIDNNDNFYNISNILVRFTAIDFGAAAQSRLVITYIYLLNISCATYHSASFAVVVILLTLTVAMNCFHRELMCIIICIPSVVYQTHKLYKLEFYRAYILRTHWICIDMRVGGTYCQPLPAQYYITHTGGTVNRCRQVWPTKCTVCEPNNS